MDKVLNRISNIILISTIAGSYLMWVVGIETKITSFIYANFAYFLILAIGIILLFKLKYLEKSDLIWIIFSIAIFLLYTLTSSMRQSNRFINVSIPVVILLLLCFKKSKFDKIDFAILTGISVVSLSITLYRIYIELPKIISPDLIWKSGNQLEAIWINTNTISATILFSVITLTIFMKYFFSGIYKIFLVPVYIAGAIGIWLCQGKTAFFTLFIFIFCDTFLPKNKMRNRISYVLTIIGSFLSLPFAFFWIAKTDTINIFSGRENIWKEFFEFWLEEWRNILFGMKPFFFHWKNLGIHNGYLEILGNLGIIGYLIFTMAVVWFIIKCFPNSGISNFKISLFFGFLSVMIMSTMENMFLTYHWMPIVYSFIGISLTENSWNKKSDEYRATK